MKKSFLKYSFYFIILIAISITACRDDRPGKDALKWSSDGKKLALINHNSDELLIAELENNKLINITVVDTGNCMAPSWSFDDNYLLYSKMKKKSFDIYTYSIKGKNKSHIYNQSASSKFDMNSIGMPVWSPVKNELIWVDQNRGIIYSNSYNGKNQKRLLKAPATHINAKWSLEGQQIIFSKHFKDGEQNNGLWIARNKGSKPNQILHSNQIIDFQIKPDGSIIAAISENIDKNKNKSYELCFIDPDGQNKQVKFQSQDKITEIDWSPDGKFISLINGTDETRNLWVIDTSSEKKVRVTFNNLDEYYGWKGQNQLLFTIDYLDKIVKQSKEIDEHNEFVDEIKGVTKDNQLILLDNFKYKKIDKNVVCYKYSSQNNAAAYFQNFHYGFSKSILYPVIKLSNDETIYLPRTRDENYAAAYDSYSKAAYQEALYYFNQYWNCDFETENYKSIFNFELSANTTPSSADSTKLENLAAGIENGAFWGTIFTLRKLNQTEKATWLFKQLNHLYFNQLKDESKPEDLLLILLTTYGKYSEFEAGIMDINTLLLTASENDSLLKSNLYAAQSILALICQKYNLSINMLQHSLKDMPDIIDDLTDLSDFMIIFPYLYRSDLLNTFEEIAARYQDYDNIDDVYELLGDIYNRDGEYEKAYSAYQNSVVKEFDEYETWEKIFELETN